MDEPSRGEKPRTSLRRLPESIQSLLGLKTYLTPSWVESVCDIIKDLPSARRIHASSSTSSTEINSAAHKDSATDASVSKLCRDIALLNAQLRQWNMQRRQALNDFLDLKGNIRVFCRIRPFLDDEIHNLGSIITSDSESVFLKLAENKSKQYSFDKIFNTQSTQEEVFSEIEPVIKSALDGYNVCIFAYGQTGTGKTFTMEGKQDSPGVVTRGIEALFRQALESNTQFQFSFSMLEIYMGGLRDLLVPQNTMIRGYKVPSLSIQMDPSGDVDIGNLIAIEVNNFDQVQSLYKLGTQLRSTASTKSNSTSSRSHCLIRISITCMGAYERRRETNKIWMVDLGGSERLLKTQASGRRLQEGKAINLSLSALGDVISALQSKRQHVPFRNSKLTQVLKDSLGTDSKTLMLVHVSPREEDLCETICSLGFAMRVRSIHLGCEEPAEMRAKKEEAMAELLQKVNHYGSKCKNVRRDIEMLKERLKKLTKPGLSSDSGIGSPDLPTYSEQFNELNRMHNTSTGASRSQPRFMKPTVCSQRKMGITYHTPVKTCNKPPLPSKKKSSSVYAESITFSANGGDLQSDYSSECGKSTINCWKGSADGGSECSQGPSEYEIQKVIVPEEKSEAGSIISLSCNSKNESRKVDREYKTKHINIENWLHSQMTEKTSTHAHRTKRVLTIPVYKASKRCNKQNQGAGRNTSSMSDFLGTKNSDMIHKENVSDFKKLNYNASVKQHGEVMSVQKPVNHMAIDEEEYYLSNPAPDKIDNKYHETSPLVKCTAEDQQELIESIKEVQVSEEPLMVYTKIFVSRSKIQPEKGCSENKTCFHSMRYPISWFMTTDIPARFQETVASEDPRVTAIDLHEENSIIGISQVFWQTIQVLWRGALLVLGIQDLGYSHDFFHGLML